MAGLAANGVTTVGVNDTAAAEMALGSRAVGSVEHEVQEGQQE
jgi:hypothetical protein